MSQVRDSFGLPGLSPHILRMGKQAKFLTVEQFSAIARLGKATIAEAIRQQRFPVSLDERKGRLLIEAEPALAWARGAAKPRPLVR